MKKAVPRPMRPRTSTHILSREIWLRKIDSFDRQVRRQNKRHRDTVVFIDANTTSIIFSDRSVPLSRLNRLTIGANDPDDNPIPRFIDY